MATVKAIQKMAGTEPIPLVPSWRVTGITSEFNLGTFSLGGVTPQEIVYEAYILCASTISNKVLNIKIDKVTIFSKDFVSSVGGLLKVSAIRDVSDDLLSIYSEVNGSTIARNRVFLDSSSKIIITLTVSSSIDYCEVRSQQMRVLK